MSEDLPSEHADADAVADNNAAGPLNLIAACAFGLEAIVRRELQAFGIDASIGTSGKVHFRGDWATVAHCNLHLRCADRVLVRVTEFPAADFDALFETTRAIDWGRWIARDAAVPVTGRSIKSTLSSVPACQRSVKRAIVDGLRRDHGCEELPETGPAVKVDVTLLSDIATLTLDTTGRSLHRRGYRTDVSKAPLKETLAAALVMLSFWKPDRPLIDPFCGSGTIPIEAARIGRGIAPGLTRDFAFTAWPEIDSAVLEDLKADARGKQNASIDGRILGSDLDKRALSAARDNAARAGVADDVHFQAGDAREVTTRRRFGCLITNPPYGRRLGRDARGDDGQLDAVYQTLPDVFRKLPTWSHYVLTAYSGFEQTVGRPADRRRKLYNGRIECTYYQYHGPKPVVETKPAGSSGETTQAATLVHAEGDAAFGQLPAKADEQAELFATRLKKRGKHLRRWPTKRGITCFRLYERDVPEIPLIVDRYEDHLHISEYQRPHDRTPAQHGNWLDRMVQTAGEVLDVPASKVHFKSRARQRGKTQHEKVDDRGRRFPVTEGGLQFLVNLDDYVDTGLFLDHRVTRAMVRDDAAGKAVLNLFAYTGSFSVYAAAGGAASTTSVDLSKTYLDWAWENMRLNGFGGNEHRFVVSDGPSFLQTHAAEPTYDLAIVDPPTFSNSKRTERDWDVQRDAVGLLSELLPLMKPDGVIYFSSNFRRFKFDAAELPLADAREISRQTVPDDFRNRRIHRCWRLQKRTSHRKPTP